MNSHIPEEICEYCASRMEFQQVYKHSSTTTQCNKHVLSTAWSQSSCSMAQVFMSLSPLLHPRCCSCCCNVCILVLTPTCSCEGSLYYNVLFPSKYISGMPKAMKRKRLFRNKTGFSWYCFWVVWWVLFSVFYIIWWWPPSATPRHGQENVHFQVK